MTMISQALPDPQAGARVARIQMEAAFALKGVSKHELLDCLAQVPGVAGKGFLRRGKSLVRVVRKAGQMAATECADALASVRGNRLGEYVDRKRAAAQGAGGVAVAWFRKAPKLWWSLRERPQEVLPELIGGLLDFWIESGGLDGNGGLPD